MKFNETKKKAIQLYLLEKIEKKDSEISKAVAENFDINQNTVHTYINELVKKGVIKRVKRGEYELIKSISKYHLSREKGELDSDTYAYEKYFYKHIQDMDNNIKSIAP